MKHRYIVTLMAWDGNTGCWRDTDVARRRSAVSAIECAQRTANRHARAMQYTAATYGRARTWVVVSDRKTGKRIFEHDGFQVPSVGEVGYW